MEDPDGREPSDSRGSPRLSYASLSVRGRLIALVVALVVLAVICVSVAVAGMFATRVKAGDSHSAFTASQVERDAYEGWIFDDDQSNDAVASKSLHDPTGLLPGHQPARDRGPIRRHRLAAGGTRLPRGDQRRRLACQARADSERSP